MEKIEIMYVLDYTIMEIKFNTDLSIPKFESCKILFKVPIV